MCIRDRSYISGLSIIAGSIDSENKNIILRNYIQGMIKSYTLGIKQEYGCLLYTSSNYHNIQGTNAVYDHGMDSFSVALNQGILSLQNGENDIIIVEMCIRDRDMFSKDNFGTVNSSL